MYSNTNTFTLINHVRNGSLNFEELVDKLKTIGYAHEDDLQLIRSSFNSINQEDFDKLFNFFYPNKVNSIQISSIGTDKGMPGNFTYAIYNSNIISHEKVLKILEKTNRDLLK